MAFNTFRYKPTVMFKIRTLLSFLLCFYGLLISAQEICDNAIDDDNDGLIDFNDDDCICQTFTPTSLIPNPSFEEMTCCPEAEAQLTCANDWIQASLATTDYVHECGILGLPFINAVAPLPMPDGQGAIGFRDGKPGAENFKEYTGACLMQPLESGKTYMLDFFVGFRDEPGSLSLDMAVYASMDCANLPFGPGDTNFGCPLNGPGYILLGEMTYIGQNEWVNATFEFTPDQDYAVIVIGPACEINDRFEQDPYFFFDRLILAEASEFGIPIIDIVGGPCSDALTLFSSQDMEGSYQWYKDGIALIGETNPNLTIDDPSSNEGIYNITVINDEGCFAGESYTLEVNEFFVEQEESICPGDTIIIGNEIIVDEGEYEIVLQSQETMCDSTILLVVESAEVPQDTIASSICSGESFVYNGIEYFEAGEYFQLIDQDDICDSLITILISLNEIDTSFIDASICFGESYVFGSMELFDAGMYDRTLQSQVTQCDSVIVLDLSIDPIFEESLNPEICSGESFTLNDETYTIAGEYFQTLQSQFGCDSIVNIDLVVFDLDTSILETTLCPGESVLINGTSYTETGIFDQLFQDVNGCDSLLRIDIMDEPDCVDCAFDVETVSIVISKLDQELYQIRFNELHTEEVSKVELENVILLCVKEEGERNSNGLLKALNNTQSISIHSIFEKPKPKMVDPSLVAHSRSILKTIDELGINASFNLDFKIRRK